MNCLVDRFLKIYKHSGISFYTNEILLVYRDHLNFDFELPELHLLIRICMDIVLFDSKYKREIVVENS